MDTLLEEFKTYLRVADYSNDYYHKIKPFLKFIEKNKINIYEIKLEDLNKFMLFVKGKYSKGYVNNLIKAIRKFYEFLIHNEKLSADIMKTIRKIKLSNVEIKIKESINKEELDDIIESSASFCDFMHPYKLRAILYFMFYTGLRSEEVIKIKRKDIKLKDKTAIVRVPTKNKREGIVLFTNKVVEYLEQYYAVEDEEKNAFNLTYKKLYSLMKYLQDFVSSGKILSPHTFRHSFANMLARNRVDMRVAQKLLRHKSIESTKIYYNPDTEIIKEIYRKTIK